jgi:transposase
VRRGWPIRVTGRIAAYTMDTSACTGRTPSPCCRSHSSDGSTRFPTVQHFWSYCRLVPGAANAAARTRHRSGNKDGNRYLKLAFSHATVRAIQYFPEIRAWYQRWKRKKPLLVWWRRSWPRASTWC